MIDMRDAFFDEVLDIAKNDPDVMLLTADMGAQSLVAFKKELPGNFINVGISEQNMVSVAAGLSLGGKKVFIYSIVPFVTMRCYEQIKIDLCCMNLPVVIIGVGAGLSYASDGPTHHAVNDIAIMRALPNMTILNPSDPALSKASARRAYENTSPSYVRIDKERLPLIYNKSDSNKGAFKIKSGKDLTIISTGNMVHNALKVSDMLKEHSISCGVIDLYKIKPLNTGQLFEFLKGTRSIITLEENNFTGGIGSAVSEFLSDKRIGLPLKRIAIPDTHCFECGSRESLQRMYGLDTESVVKVVKEWQQ